VHLKLHQGSPKEICQMLLEGEVDIGFATEALAEESAFATFPLFSWRHAVVVPAGHPLLDEAHVSLEHLADYPIITYHEGFTGRARIEEAFKTAGLTPDIVMSAMDADVIKTYVELELGIGIIASLAFSKERDASLRLLKSSHLFPDNQTKLAIRKGHLLRRYAFSFIEMCAPSLTQEYVLKHLISSESA
jgi:LysR family cys regulon transcriptional activator